MHIAEQFNLDLDGQNPESRWNANRAQSAMDWTPEAMAMVWTLGVSDWDWWNSPSLACLAPFLALTILRAAGGPPSVASPM